MSGRFRRLARALAPSGLAAVTAVLVAGFIDGQSRPGFVEPLAAAGFVAAWAVPLAFVLSLALRAIGHGWRVGPLVEGLREPDTGGTPRLMAWLVFVLLAGFVLAATVLQGMNLVTQSSGARVVYALAAPIIAVAAAAMLVVLSRPSVSLIGRGFTAADRWLHGRFGRSVFHPLLCAGVAASCALVMVALAWVLVISPKIGHFDLSYLPLVLLAVLILVVVPWLWSWSARWRLARAALAAALCTASVASVVTAGWIRTQQPFAMMEIWGETELAGFAIDRLLDIEELRSELHLEGIRPVAKAGVQRHPDIILITVDTLRADRTPPYGGNANMPTLAQLGQRGAVFEWAISPGNVTRRSLPSIAMGVSAPRLRGRVRGWALKLDPRHVTLAERLRAGGYDTAGFFCCLSQFGARHRLGLIRGIDHIFIDKSGDTLARKAAEFLARRKDGDKPLFMWLHLIEPHGWIKAYPSTPEARTYAQRYDLTLADVDRALSTLVDGIKQRDQDLDQTIVALTSDHGEGLGDHGTRTHSESLHNSELRVPLILLGPGVPDVRIERPVPVFDLAPTLMDLAGFVPPGMPEMDGVSLVPILEGTLSSAMDAGEAYAAMIPDRSVSTEQRALIVGNYKIIVKGKKVELFDLVSDPKEARDLAKSRPEIRDKLLDRLRQRQQTDELAPFD